MFGLFIWPKFIDQEESYFITSSYRKTACLNSLTVIDSMLNTMTIRNCVSTNPPWFADIQLKALNWGIYRMHEVVQDRVSM